MSTKINEIVGHQEIAVHPTRPFHHFADFAHIPSLTVIMTPVTSSTSKLVVGGSTTRSCHDPRGPRSVDHLIYQLRNPIERFFNKLKHIRRVAIRTLAAPAHGLGFESTTYSANERYRRPCVRAPADGGHITNNPHRSHASWAAHYRMPADRK
jgi:transposase